MTEAAKATRNVTVETPGEVAAPDAPEVVEPVANDKVKPKHRVRETQDYRTMRAHEVDPTKITSPVLTLDGYVCPGVPEKQ